MPETRSYGFSRNQRIRKKTDFDAIFALRRRYSKGPLVLFVQENALGLSRLGIAMSRRVGIAARRNRIKRMLRQAFRLSQHELPIGWDLMVVPRPHAPLGLENYIALLRELAGRGCTPEGGK